MSAAVRLEKETELERHFHAWSGYLTENPQPRYNSTS